MIKNEEVNDKQEAKVEDETVGAAKEEVKVMAKEHVNKTISKRVVIGAMEKAMDEVIILIIKKTKVKLSVIHKTSEDIILGSVNPRMVMKKIILSSIMR